MKTALFHKELSENKEGEVSFPSPLSLFKPERRWGLGNSLFYKENSENKEGGSPNPLFSLTVLFV